MVKASPKLATPSQMFFFPELGMSVEAESLAAAQKLIHSIQDDSASEGSDD